MCALGQRALSFVYCFALISTLAGHYGAWAAPFLQEDGRTQIIITSTFDKSDRFCNASGKLQALAQYRELEMMTYAEFGATDWLTLIFAPSSSQSMGSVAGIETADRYARVDAGARARLWQGDHSIVSFQASIRAPYAFQKSDPQGLRRETNEADIRIMYGYSFEIWERTGFAGAEFGYRLRTGAVDEWRADLTLGYRVTPGILILMQNFNFVAKAMALEPYKRSHKFQLSAIFDITETWSLQGGAYTTALGVNVRKESGVVGGLWRKF